MKMMYKTNDLQNTWKPMNVGPIFNYCLCDILWASVKQAEPLNDAVCANFCSFLSQEVWVKSKPSMVDQPYSQKISKTPEWLGTSWVDSPHADRNSNEWLKANSSDEPKTQNSNSTEVELFRKTKAAEEADRNHRHSSGINLDVLKGHKYKIVYKPTTDSNESNYEYIWKYGNCGKVFNKTYNLVYHFRVHTHEKPFKCQHWSKLFSQKGNLGRHLERHRTDTVEERKVYSCDKCPRSYTSVYNLRVS